MNWSALAVRLGCLLVVAVAVVAAVVGTDSWLRQRSADAAPLAVVQSDGVSVTARTADWLDMQHDDGGALGGYQMPAQMMPGAPLGDDMRLGVPINLVNRSGEDRQFAAAKDFTLGGGKDDKAVPVKTATFDAVSRLGAGTAVDGVLYFDLPMPEAGDPPLYLNWTGGDGSRQRLAVRLAADPHGS